MKQFRHLEAPRLYSYIIGAFVPLFLFFAILLKSMQIAFVLSLALSGICFSLVNRYLIAKTKYMTQIEKKTIQFLTLYTIKSACGKDALTKTIAKIFIDYPTKSIIDFVRSDMSRAANFTQLCRFFADQDHSLKYFLIYNIFKINIESGKTDAESLERIKKLSQVLKIHTNVFLRIQNMFVEFHFHSETAQESLKSFEHTQIEHAYMVLGLSPGTHISDIKKKFRILAKQTHPDRFTNKDPELVKMKEDEFLKINEAYQILVRHFE